MALFLSNFINKLDKKGRVSVPASFRAVLGLHDNCNGIIIYKSFINLSIEACSMSRMEQINRSIEQLDPYSEEKDAFATTILGDSILLNFDPEGRVIIPEEFIEFAHLNELVCFVGKGNTFELWNPDKFTSYAKNARELAKATRSKLRLNTESGNNGVTGNNGVIL